MDTICTSDIVHYKNDVLDIRYGAGHKLTGDVDELDLFLIKHDLRPIEIVLTYDQYTNFRESSMRKKLDKNTRTICRLTVRQFGH